MHKELIEEGSICRSSLSHAIMEKIMRAINTGELKIGDRLPPISQLAKSLKVGQGSIREETEYTKRSITGQIDKISREKIVNLEMKNQGPCPLQRLTEGEPAMASCLL